MLGFSIKIQHRLLLLVFLLCLSTTDANAGFLTPHFMRDHALRMKEQYQKEEQSCVLEIHRLKRAYKRNPTTEIAEQIDSLTAKREKIQKEIEFYDQILSRYTPYEFTDSIVGQGHLYSTNCVIPVKGGGRMSFALFLSNSAMNIGIKFRGNIEDAVGKFTEEQISTGRNTIENEVGEGIDLKNQTIRLNADLYSNNTSIKFEKQLMDEAVLAYFLNPLKFYEIKYDNRYYIYTATFISSLSAFDTSRNIKDMTEENRNRYLANKFDYVLHELTYYGIGNIEFGGHKFDLGESAGHIFTTIELIIAEWSKLYP